MDEQTVRSMDDFYRIFLPDEWKKQQRDKRIKEVGIGVVMAEEAIEKVFGPAASFD